MNTIAMNVNDYMNNMTMFVTTSNSTRTFYYSYFLFSDDTIGFEGESISYVYKMDKSVINLEQYTDEPGFDGQSFISQSNQIKIHNEIRNKKILSTNE